MPTCTTGIRGWHWRAALSWALENAHQQPLWPQNAPSPSHDNQKHPRKLPDDLNLGDKIDIFGSIDTFVHLGPNDPKAGGIRPRKETLKALTSPTCRAFQCCASFYSTAPRASHVHSCTPSFSNLFSFRPPESSKQASRHGLHCTAGSHRRSLLSTVCAARQALIRGLFHSAVAVVHRPVASGSLGPQGRQHSRG